ncbi:MAG: hypothetical protein M3O46_01235, partial [Myxococcota bacterium]|nr:hypothetical protein [Myxococcota bacterium]
TTTSRPVASSERPSRQSLSPRAKRAVALAGATLVVVVVGIAWIAAPGGSSAGAQVGGGQSAGSGARSLPTLPAPTVVAISPLAPPEISAMDLPVASEEKPASPRWSGRRSGPSAPSAIPSAGTRGDCQPPYVVDATGKQHWKLECL